MSLTFQGHVSDMKFGFSDLPSSLPHVEPPSHLGVHNGHFPALLSRSADISWANFSRDLATAPSKRFASSLGIRIDSAFLLNSFGKSTLSSLGLTSSRSFSLRGKENDQSANTLGDFQAFLIEH